MTKLLDDALEAARRLPPEMQDTIARVVLRLAGTDDEVPVALSAGERTVIAASKAAASRGEFATDDQVRATWAKHGLWDWVYHEWERDIAKPHDFVQEWPLSLVNGWAGSCMATEMGEYIVGAYLKLVQRCSVIDYNARPPGGGLEGLGELDVIGFDLSNKLAYLCEVTTHLDGLQGIAHPPSGSIEIMFIKGLSIQTGSEPILSILERSAWGDIRGHVLK